MAVTFKSFSVGPTTASSNNAISVTCPTGTTTNDLLIFFAANDAPNYYASASTGLTAIDRPTTYAYDLGSACWYKFATGSDVAGSTSYSVTKHSDSTVTVPQLLVCLCYSGADPSAFPLGSTKHAYTQQSSSSSGTTNANAQCPSPVNPSSVSSTDLVLRAYMIGEDAASTGLTMTGPPSGWTQRGAGSTTTNVSGSSNGWNVGMMICDRTGATDTATISSNKKGSWATYTMAIAALPDAPTNQFMPFFGI